MVKRQPSVLQNAVPRSILLSIMKSGEMKSTVKLQLLNRFIMNASGKQPNGPSAAPLPFIKRFMRRFFARYLFKFISSWP